MSIKTTIQEVIESLISGNCKITDCSNNGKCSKCGECCSNFLPVSQKEIDTIQEYAVKNRIEAQMHMLVMQNKLTCPYFDGKKCLIYEVRPLICKEFYCYKEPDFAMAKKFQEEDYVTVNMWAIAQEIEKYKKRKGKKWKKLKSKEIK